MPWFTTDRVSVIIAALALLGALFGWWTNRTAVIEAKRDASDARAIAERAVTAAEGAAGSQDSMAISLNTLATRTDNVEASLDAYLPKRSADWTLTHSHGRLFHLQNTGNAVAYEVEVASPNSVRFDGPELVADWPIGTAKELFVLGSSQTGTPVVRVTWGITPIARDSGLPEQVWEHPIPPGA